MNVSIIITMIVIIIIIIIITIIVIIVKFVIKNVLRYLKLHIFFSRSQHTQGYLNLADLIDW